MIHRLRRSLRVPQPLSAVFDFFAAPENLERITPPQLRFRIVTPLPIRMAAGTIIDHHLRVHGVPLHWKTLITRWQPEQEFVDEQLAGPYRLWVHRHSFRADGGGTTIEDEVRYELPAPPLGELGWPLVAFSLRRIFDFRQRVIPGLLEG